MNDRNRTARIITLGKKRFIVLYGVLGWGLLTAALFTAETFYFKGRVDGTDIVIPFILFPMGGLFWGAFVWSLAKKRYDDSLTTNSK